MKRILILLIGLIGVAYGQSNPTSAKTRFVNGLYVGTKLDAYFNAADSNAIYWRADSALMAKYKGTARALAFSGDLGVYKLIADTFFTTGYTTRARTKQVSDSLAAKKLNLSGGTLTGALIGTSLTMSSGAEIVSGSTNTAGLIVRGGSSVGAPATGSGQVLVGATAAYRGSIAYDDNVGHLFIDNLYDNANSNIYLRTRTNGTPINALTIVGSGAATFSSSATANSFVKSGGASSDFLMANGSTLSKNEFYIGDATFDTTTRTLNIPKAGGGSTSVVIPRGAASGASGITALSNSRTGNLVTVQGDNGSTTVFSIRDADSASLVKFSDTASMLSNYYRTSTATGALALKLNISDTASMLLNYYRASSATGALAAKLNISDTALMLSPYRRTSIKITNSDLVNSTISGIALGSNLNSLTAGNGLTGTAYNGSTAYTWQVDTSTISTKANVTGLLTGYATTGSVSLKLNISDTTAMLSPYLKSAIASSTYVPYIGATQKLDLGSNELQAKSTGATHGVRVTGTAGGARSILLAGQDGFSNGFQVQYNGTKMAYSMDNGNLTLTDTVIASSIKRQSGTSSQFLKADGSIDNNTYLTSSDIAGKLNIADTAAMLTPYVQYSDTASMLSPYRRTTTKITNSDLTNSTISGIPLGSNLASLTPGNGLSGTAFNGNTNYTWRVDTSVISTKANVTALLTGYATTAASALKLNISDTATMLNNYARLSGANFTGNIVGKRISMTDAGTSAPVASILSNGSGQNDILIAGKNGVSNGFTVRYNGSKMVYNMDLGGLTVSDTVTSSSFKRSGGTSSQFLKADGSVDGNTYLTSAGISGKLNISDTSSMLSPYRRTSTLIQQSEVNGVVGALANKVNIGDTSIMLLPYLRKYDTTSMLSNYARTSSLGGYAYRSSGLAELSGAAFTSAITGTSLGFTSSGSTDYVASFISNGTGANNILLAGKSGVSNGFQVQYNGTSMVYTMNNGNLGINGSATATSFIKSGGTSSQYLMADGSTSTTGAATSGVYLPTATNVSNTSSIAIDTAQWMRVGNVVTVSGRISFINTLNSPSQISITLPVATIVSSVRNVAGVANENIAMKGAIIRGRTGTNDALLEVDGLNSSTYTMYYTYTYRIL